MVQTEQGPPAGVIDFQEAGLIRKAKKGDAGAFEELYRKFVPRVFGLCLRMAGETNLAEELTQEVFVRLWQKLHLFSGNRPFTPWLMTLAANVVRSSWRARNRRPDSESAVEEIDRMEDGSAESPAGVADGIDLERAIRTLPDGARHIFVLHDIEGYRHVEIAEMLGLAVGTTKAQLHRARRMLKEVLAL